MLARAVPVPRRQRDARQDEMRVRALQDVAAPFGDGQRFLSQAQRIALLPSPSGRGLPEGRGEGEAVRLAQEALTIADRCGYVLQGADAHLVLARIALAAGDREGAREHAQEARRLATCDGPPDYTYKVAYDEAGALLARLEN